MGLGIVFSGQGNQYPEMLNKLYQHNPACINNLALKLRLDLNPQINLSHQELFSNRYSQTLISAYQYLLWQELAAHIVEPVAFCGYSLGEVTAFAVSSNMGIDNLLNIVNKRAQLMSASGEGESGLVAVSGLALTGLNTICDKFNCYVAIKNGREQYIIGGKTQDLNNCISHLASIAPMLKLSKLDVAIASHTPILKPAGLEFADYLTQYGNTQLASRLITGVSASVCYNAGDFIPDLARQLYSTIKFEQVIQILYELGASTILEIGPGHGLANIIKQYRLPLKVKSIDDFSSITGVITWLKKEEVTKI